MLSLDHRSASSDLTQKAYMHLAPGYSFTLPVKGCQATDVGLTSQKDRFIGIESQLGSLDGTPVVHPIRAELRGAEFWTLAGVLVATS